MADLLSHIILIGPFHPGMMSFISRPSHMPSLVASDAATNSASVVDRATHECLRLLQATGPPWRRKRNPEVDLREPGSPA